MAALYTALSLVTPYLLDDWTFMGVYRDDVDGGYAFSFRAWSDYYQYIRGFDNGRIANFLSPLSTMFTPWKELFPFLTGLLMPIIAILILPFREIEPGADGKLKALLLAFAWGLMIVGLPWRDTIFVRDYALNYIWASAINLAFLRLLWLICDKERARHDTTWILIPAILLAITAGGWHEGFAAATLCGLGLLAIARRFRLPGRFYLLTSIYLLSAIIFAMSPGMVGRIADHTGLPVQFSSIRTYVILLIVCVLLVIHIIRITQRKGDWKLNRSDSTILTVAVGIVFGGYFIAMATVNTARSYFWPDLAAICVALLLIKRIAATGSRSSKSNPGRKRTFSLISVLVALLCSAQSVSVIVWQDRYRKESEEIVNLLEHSETGIVYYDFKYPDRAPWYTLDIPTGNRIWFNPWHLRSVNIYILTPTIEVRRLPDNEIQRLI